MNRQIAMTATWYNSFYIPIYNSFLNNKYNLFTITIMLITTVTINEEK